MKTILFMAISADGFVATANHKTPWSDEDWDNFKEIVKKVGNIIIGRKTYEIMNKYKGFEDLGNSQVIVVTKNTKLKKSEPNHLIANSSEKALELLKKERFNQALIAGGGKLNSSFMKKKLIDEIYLDIEPILFGKGIKLFEDGEFSVKLKLIGTKKYSPNGIQLHYKVLK